jgi:hypothetical protein
LADLLEPLKPIAAIIGPAAVRAYYSDQQLGSVTSGYRPGWKVVVSGEYGGANIEFSVRAPTLREAAGNALKQLRVALEMD